MGPDRRSRLLLALALLALAALALASSGAAAEERHGDWTVSDHQYRQGETIVVDGQLTIGISGTLYLDDCDLFFTDGVTAATRIDVLGGRLVLSDSSIAVRTPSIMVVSGRLEVEGNSSLAHMDILVRATGTMDVRRANLVLSGSYTSPSDNDPLTLSSDGSLSVQESRLDLYYAFIQSQGVMMLARSTIDSSVDYGEEYMGYDEKVRLARGTVTLVDSSLTNLWKGIYSQASLSVDGCRFNNSPVRLLAPWWQQEFTTLVDGSVLDSSDLSFVVEDERLGSLNLDLIVSGTQLRECGMELMLQDHYEGRLLLENVSIIDHQQFAVRMEAHGFEGSLEWRDLEIEGPWGISVRNDFSGMVLASSQVRVDKTAIVFHSDQWVHPARLEDLLVTGEVGLVARNAALKVTGSDLRGVRVPVRGEGGAAMTLTDCLLEVDDAELSVAPRQRNAQLRVRRTLEVEEVRWDIGDPITDGEVLFYTPTENVTPPPLSWPVGSMEMPVIQTLEWTAGEDGTGTRLLFDVVRPVMELDHHPFRTLEDLDPWEEGPYALVFHDDKRPVVTLDPGFEYKLRSPSLVLQGSVSDVGTGLASVTWTLHDSSGDQEAGGPMDLISGQRWTTRIHLTSNMQYVRVRAVDRTGNVQPLTTPPFYVEVPTPTLTILSPRSGAVTNDPVVRVSGSAASYADRVTLHVLGHEGSVTAEVVHGGFEVLMELPHEGPNHLVVGSLDPYDGSDTKYIHMELDTVPPGLAFNGLRVDDVNYVTHPYLVVEGSTTDANARVQVQGQRVGLLSNQSFATTVQLAEGEQVLRVTATDPAGNVNSVGIPVLLDTQPPDLTLVKPAANPFWSSDGKVDVVIRANEPIRLLDGEAPAGFLEDDTIIDTVGLYHDRPTEVQYSVEDVAGNVATLSLVLHLDTQPPILVVLSPRSGAILNATTVRVVATASEPGCTLTADGRPLETIERQGDQVIAAMDLPGPDGERRVILGLVDRAGNIAAEELVLSIDTLWPTIALDGIANGSIVTAGKFEVRGRTEAGVKAVHVNEVMARVFPDGTFTATIELEEGWQDVVVSVVDPAGNPGWARVRIKALASPDVELPVEALAGGTILVVLAAMLGSTEAGRWSLMLLFLPLYTKLRKDRILDQRTRGLIQGYITANPGCNYTVIRDNLELADGTLTYHLQVLEREGYVYSIREGLFRCFYPQGVPPPKRGKLHLSDTQSDIVRIVKRIPGITVGEIATAMNRRPNVISYHLKLLREGGLVRMEEDGRHVRVYPIESAVAMI